MNKIVKKLSMLTLAVAVAGAGVIGMAAYEAHVINVTAHIENALAVDPHGIDFGTVFPQEYLEEDFTVSLSDSFMGEDQRRVRDVEYKIVQKPKLWIDNFEDGVFPPHRSMTFIDPDSNGTQSISGGVLTITTGNDVEDLYGPGEPASGTDWTAPRMVMHMGGNFTVETKVTASPNGFVGPDGRYQSGGILVYGSDGNIIRLELTRWGAGTGSNAVYMESQENGVKVGKRYTMNEVGDTVYLKVSRNGDKFKGEYSTDGSTWQEAPVREGLSDFTNENISDYPYVGVAVTDNQDGSSFSADFEYVEMNGAYGDLCRFLSKIGEPGEYGHINVPSYYSSALERCEAPDPDIAAGYLYKCLPEDTNCTEDNVDCWKVDLKVPPVDGYVGQDWPDSCRDWTVPVDGADYGCDLWIEVTGFSYF